MVEGEQSANTGRRAEGVVIIMANDAAVSRSALTSLNGAKWAQIEKWPCISGVHDKIFMKFGYHISCREIK